MSQVRLTQHQILKTIYSFKKIEKKMVKQSSRSKKKKKKIHDTVKRRLTIFEDDPIYS